MKWFRTIAMMTALVSVTGSLAAGATPPRGIVQSNNVNDPVNHPYSQTASNNSCAAYSCSIAFPATTATETLIQHVSCSYDLPTGGTTIFTGLFNYTTGDSNYLPVITSNANFGAGTYEIINESTYLFAQNGTQPTIVVNTGTSAPIQDLSCTISGYHN